MNFNPFPNSNGQDDRHDKQDEKLNGQEDITSFHDEYKVPASEVSLENYVHKPPTGY